MDNYTAVMIAEGVEEAESFEQMVEAWQHLIDTGLAWRLQGCFGRQAARMIEMGICEPATEARVA
jgi:fatty acid-binding protein DegV